MLAVTRIQEMFAWCPHLIPLVDSNDKTPFTDGHIDVYRSTSRTNEDWIGRVPVQIKGRKQQKQSRAKSFKIERAELQAFQREGGVLLFVVDIDQKSGNRTAYYAALSPAYCARLLTMMTPVQRTKTVPVKPFPTEAGDIERIVQVALKAQETRPEHGLDPALINSAEVFNIYSAVDLDLDKPLLLTPGEIDFAIEMRTTGGMTVPLAGAFQIFPPEYVEHRLGLPISAGPSTYEDAKIRRITSDTFKITLDGGLTLHLLEQGNRRKITFNLTLHSNFASRIKAMEFVAAVADNLEVTFGDQQISVGAATDDAQWRKGDLLEHLARLRDLRELFKALGVDGSLINMDEVTDVDLRNLRELHSVFVKGKEPSFLATEVVRAVIAIGKWCVMIVIVHGDKPGTWRYINPFDPSSPAQYVWAGQADDGTHMSITPYDAIAAVDLSSMLNLHLESIVETYRMLADVPGTTSRATLRVLALVSSADMVAERQDEFLDAAERLNEWVISVDGDTPRYLVNRWQILWRRGELTDAHRTHIRQVKRSHARAATEATTEVEIACALLLDERAEARELLAELTNKARTKMKDWPIWRLFERRPEED